MTDETKTRRKSVVLQSLNYVGKIFLTAIIIVLFIIGAFLIYYIISARVLSKGDGLAVPKFSLYTIVSGSMEPDIRVYDVILDVRIDDPRTIKVGDVITFISTSTISKDMTVTHRVMDIREVNGKVEFVTKGDNNLTADSDTAKEDKLIGKTILKIPQLGRIQFFLATKIGWFVVILIPALSVIIYDVIKLFKLLGVKDSHEKIKSDENIRKEEDKKIIETLEKIKRYADEKNE